MTATVKLPPTTTDTIVARPYERVSRDRDGTSRSTDRQHVANEHAANEHGWLLGTRLVDDDRSASRYARRAREGYDRLIAELEADTFGAQVLILWESSRGSRTVLEWVTLLDLLERRGVLVHVTTHARTYNPRNPRDRRSMLEDACDSEYETAKSSTRIKDGHAMNAQAGMPHNCPFGYAREHKLSGGKKVLVRQYPHPDEAPVVREMFDRLAAGHSLRSIQLDFEAKGYRTRNGGTFADSVLRSMATNPAYAGLRVHNGVEIDGNRDVWEPVISRERFELVRELFASRKQQGTKPGRGEHLLSGIGACDVCGGKLARMAQKGRPDMYRCHPHACVRVDYGELNDLAERIMLGYLADPRNIDRFRANDGRHDTELQAARDTIAATKAELGTLEADVEAGKYDDAPMVAAAAEKRYRARLDTARQQERELSTPSALRMLPPGEDIELRWQAAPMSTRREVARYLLSPEILGELRVVRAPVARHAAPITDRVVWR